MSKGQKISLFLMFLFFAVVPRVIFAQETEPAVLNSDNHTAREEAEGKAVWNKLQSKELACAELTNENFEVLGEYFMGQMLGNSHEAMNTMMIQMLGEEGEEQKHLVMGKRLSGCDTAAVFPTQGLGFMPMMNMLAPYGTASSRSETAQPAASPNNLMSRNVGWPSMMNFGTGGWWWVSMVFTALWWIFVIAALVAAIWWLVIHLRGGAPAGGKNALDILKERYVKGEITKKEFEAKKKDLV